MTDPDIDGDAAAATVDPAEIARFSAMAAEWWDPGGKFAPLHKLNPARLGYIRDRLCARFGRDARALRPFEGLGILDVGCGGGLVTEPMARLGASATGIDAAARNIGIARTHAEEAGLAIDYRVASAEALAATGARFDAVLALEIVEHVADIDLFLASCAALVRPGGALILSTLNRTAKSFLFAIVGAEYVLRWLPRGTHSWEKFVKPSELADGLARAGAAVADISGMVYNPLNDDWRLGRDVSVNYLVYATRDGDAD